MSTGHNFPFSKSKCVSVHVCAPRIGRLLIVKRLESGNNADTSPHRVHTQTYQIIIICWEWINYMWKSVSTNICVENGFFIYVYCPVSHHTRPTAPLPFNGVFLGFAVHPCERVHSDTHTHARTQRTKMKDETERTRKKKMEIMNVAKNWVLLARC